MKILHYSLGFPPYRTGGLTKFCMDLMGQQVKEGHEVSLLWPGEIQLLSRRTRIRQKESVDGIKSFEVVNPTPVSFDEGIKDFNVFKAPGDEKAYEILFKHTKPDVIHVHTLMGLHKSFLNVAKKKGIRLVFTTHDFFPICPKVTMFRHGQICSCIESCEKCGVCNNTALSLKKIQVLQSPLYRSLKDSAFVKKLRKQHRDEYLGDDSERDANGSVGTPEDYRKLRRYYHGMLSMMDMIHYNSTVTQSAYEKVFDLPNSKVISITHADIGDHRKRKDFKTEQLRIRYLGPQSAAKGYYFLKEALDDLWKRRKDFRLDVHFNPIDKPAYLMCHDRYDYSRLEQVFDNTDVLVCPSVWYETFGYTVLEALSYGVPVVVSDHVGAKDILKDECGIVYRSGNLKDFHTYIESLNNKRLAMINDSICQSQNIKTIEKMSNEIELLYQGLDNTVR